MRRLDAGVEEGDRDAAAVETRKEDVRPDARPRSEATLLDHRRGERGRIGDPDRVDARHLRRMLEERDRARVEGCGEAGEHSRVAKLGLDLHALLGEPRDEEVVGCQRGRRPLPFLSFGRPPARGSHAVGERRAVQDDDHALAYGHLLPR